VIPFQDINNGTLWKRREDHYQTPKTTPEKPLYRDYVVETLWCCCCCLSNSASTTSPFQTRVASKHIHHNKIGLVINKYQTIRSKLFSYCCRCPSRVMLDWDCTVTVCGQCGTLGFRLRFVYNGGLYAIFLAKLYRYLPQVSTYLHMLCVMVRPVFN